MNILKRAWTWLITKHEKVNKMADEATTTEQTSAESATAGATTTEPATAETTATEVAATDPVSTEEKAGVSDFEKALAFVEAGLAQLGDAAKDDLVALAKKFL